MRTYSSSSWGGDSSRSYLLILVTLFLSLVLEFLPWPGWVLQYKPTFPDLALIYWVIHRPRVVNYEVAVLMGVLLDLAGHLPLGFTALSYTLLVLLANIMRGRFSLLGPLGQAIHVFFALCCKQAVLLALKFAESGHWTQLDWRLFLPSAVTAVLWLFLPLLMRQLGGFFRRDE